MASRKKQVKDRVYLRNLTATKQSIVIDKEPQLDLNSNAKVLLNIKEEDAKSKYKLWIDNNIVTIEVKKI